jgi:hypothetical protein
MIPIYSGNPINGSIGYYNQYNLMIWQVQSNVYENTNHTRSYEACRLIAIELLADQGWETPLVKW